MHPNAQIFINQLPAPATALAGIASINQYDPTASLFRFARPDEYELIHAASAMLAMFKFWLYGGYDNCCLPVPDS
jgi:hypothetical protein